MDLTPNNLQTLFQSYRGDFQRGLSSLGEQGVLYEQFCTVVPSSTAVEIYPFLKTLPRMREWLGDRVVHSLEGSAFSIRNRKFELTEGVPRDSIEDDTHGLYSPVFEEFGRSAREHPNELAVEVLTANPDSYDGQPLFDTDHPVLGKGGAEQSVSNDMGGSGPAWYVMDLTRAIKPMIFQRRRDYDFRAISNLDDARMFLTDELLFGVDARVNAGPGLWQLIIRSNQPFDAANYEVARKALQELKGDYGRPLALRHSHTMVPNGMEGAARKILKNALTTGGASNAWAGTSNLLINPWLSNS